MQGRDKWVRDLDVMQRQMNRFLEHVASKPPLIVFSPARWQPLIDMYETDDELVVTVELAGIKREEVEVVVDQDTLTVRGTRCDSCRKPRQRYYVMEINVGSFERSLALPVKVDTERVSAEYDNGFLRIVMPRARAAETQRIAIQQEG